MFRQIPIEISVGCLVILLTPVQIPPKGMPIVEFIHSVVGKVIVIGAVKWIFAEDPKNMGNYIKVPDWRIVRYTYGGIWLDNRKFDQRRIDTENLDIIAKKLPANSKPAVTGATKSTNPVGNVTPKSAQNP